MNSEGNIKNTAQQQLYDKMTKDTNVKKMVDLWDATVTTIVDIEEKELDTFLNNLEKR